MYIQQDLSLQVDTDHNFSMSIEWTNNGLNVDPGFVIAKTSEDLSLFIEMLRNNRDEFEEIRKERETETPLDTEDQALSSGYQECSIQTQFYALHFNCKPCVTLEYSEKRNKTSNVLNEIRDSLPDEAVVIGRVDRVGQFMPFKSIRLFGQNANLDSPDAPITRDMVSFSPDEVLPFVKTNYRSSCSNRSEEHDRDVAESIMNIHEDLSSRRRNTHRYPVSIDRTNSMLHVDSELVVAKTPNVLKLFINTLRDNRSEFERIRQERGAETLPETQDQAPESQDPASDPTSVDTE
ncbi:MAG: hypothetical protein LBR89_01000 [Holosporales bacterium]|jgi:glutaredoxin-related protein|nr:hypothetical protein [Holosporales bacterium]